MVKIDECRFVVESRGIKMATDKIIEFENGIPRLTTFVARDVRTSHDVVEKIYKKYPVLENRSLILKIWSSANGTAGRQECCGILAKSPITYVSLHLAPNQFISSCSFASSAGPIQERALFVSQT